MTRFVKFSRIFFICPLRIHFPHIVLLLKPDRTEKNTDMKSFENQKCRLTFSSRPQIPRTLHGNRTIVSITLISLLLLPAFLASSCRKSYPDNTGVPAPPVPERDSVKHSISIEYASSLSSENGLEGSLDLFIFDDSPSGPVDRILHFDGNPGQLEFYCYSGDKIIAAVANSPKAFNPLAISRYSSLQLIEYGFREDNPQNPIMGGLSSMPENEPAELRLEPLICEIRLESISNGLDGYELLEKPRIRLCNLNGSAKLFEEGRYEPQEIDSYGEWAELPYDIGMFPQKLSIPLYCYPNESGEESTGAYCTMLELECQIKGVRKRFRFPIPEIRRASVTLCGIYVFSEDDADCEFTTVLSGEAE